MEKVPVTIRPIEVGDKERWLELWEGYLTFYETSLDPHITALTWERLNDPEFEMHGILAVVDGRVIGFAHFLYRPSTWAVNGYCYLEDLFVDPSIRGAGAGRSLIDAVIVAARAKKSGRVYWTTKESNTQARVLYDSYSPASEFVQYRLPQTY
ncbi:MAG: GNAT family N-acetyltransferase [Actinomycetes bacterium]